VDSSANRRTKTGCVRDLNRRDHQKIISRRLGGYAVENTPGGSTRLEALLNGELERVVVDYNLGDMNGIDFVRLLRGQTLPVDFLMSIENIRGIREKMSSASGGKKNVKDSSGESVMEFMEDNLELRILSIKDDYGSNYTLFIETYLIENKTKLAEMSDMIAV